MNLSKIRFRLVPVLMVLCSLFSATVALAQDTVADVPEMADVMRSNGKIYVVVGILLIIFTGMIVYLVRLDRKISKLEKEN